MARTAAAAGIAINVLTMEGEDCSLEAVGAAADITNGVVQIVDPATLADAGVDITALLGLDRPTLGGAGVATLIIGGGLGIKVKSAVVPLDGTSATGEHDSGQDDAGFETIATAARCVHAIGAITVDSDLTFLIDTSPAIGAVTHGFRNDTCEKTAEDAKALTSLVAPGIKDKLKSDLRVPLQLQVQYDTPSGEKRLLVLSSTRTISTDRAECEGATPLPGMASQCAANPDETACSFDPRAVAISSVRFAACQAQGGAYLAARATLISTQRLLQRAMCHNAAAAEVSLLTATAIQEAYLSFIVQAEKLDQFMRELQMKETVFGQVAASDRGKERDDAASQAMYKMKNLSTADFRRRN